MSKTLIVLLIAVGVGVAINRNQNSADAAITSSAEDVAADVPAQKSFLGKIGVRLVEAPVTRMSEKTQASIKALAPALNRAQGVDARRAREAVRKATDFDTRSRQELESAHPVRAVRAAFDARSHAQVARAVLNGP